MLDSSIKKKVVDSYLAGNSYKKISQDFGISIKSVGGIIDRSGSRKKPFRYSEAVILNVEKLHKLKIPVKDISVKTDIPISSLEKILAKKGLSYNNFKPIKLTDYQLEVLIGCVLGDSWLGLDKLSLNPRFTISHSTKQLEYVEHKFNIFSNLLADKISIHHNLSYIGGRKVEGDSAYCKSKANSELIIIQNLFYEGGKKVLKPELINYITPVSMAFWYMDDGYKIKSKYSTSGYIICTDCFSEIDLKTVIKVLKDLFSINFKIQKRGKYLRLAVYNKIDRTLFVELVKPYIIASMQYKL